MAWPNRNQTQDFKMITPLIRSANMRTTLRAERSIHEQDSTEMPRPIRTLDHPLISLCKEAGTITFERSGRKG